MRFLLKLRFSHGKKKSSSRIMAEGAAVGQFTIEEWPPPGYKKFSAFRRIARFRIERSKDHFALYDPYITRVTEQYMEVIGQELDGEAFYLQAWVLYHVPASVIDGFDPRDDDREE